MLAGCLAFPSGTGYSTSQSCTDAGGWKITSWMSSAAASVVKTLRRWFGSAGPKRQCVYWAQDHCPAAAAGLTAWL